MIINYAGFKKLLRGPYAGVAPALCYVIAVTRCPCHNNMIIIHLNTRWVSILARRDASPKMFTSMFDSDKMHLYGGGHRDFPPARAGRRKPTWYIYVVRCNNVSVITLSLVPRRCVLHMWVNSENKIYVCRLNNYSRLKDTSPHPSMYCRTINNRLVSGSSSVRILYTPLQNIRDDSVFCVEKFEYRRVYPSFDVHWFTQSCTASDIIRMPWYQCLKISPSFPAQ